MSLITRRELLKTALILSASIHHRSTLLADSNTHPFAFTPDKELIPAPDNPADRDSFRTHLAAWREDAKKRLHYSDALYCREDFAWASACFSCYFLMLCEEPFLPASSGRFQEQWIRQTKEKFGGMDSVVLWHAYPRIGVDNRNQYDFYRDQPGGLKGLHSLVQAFHEQDVKVFLDYNPWDTGTRREDSDDLAMLAEFVSTLDADGIFLDTMSKGAEEFRAKLDSKRKGVVLEGEIALPLENIHNHHLSWAQWFEDSAVPGILRNKWFERRHLQHQIRRWDTDHTGELHTAWMNGSGMMIWENVFGSWLGWNERDRSIYRAMQPVQHRYKNLFCGEGWIPLAPTEHPNIFASLWHDESMKLWTLVNRSEETIQSPLLAIPFDSRQKIYDLIQGNEAEIHPAAGEKILVHGTIPPRGIAGFLSCDPQKTGADFLDFLSKQNKIHKTANYVSTPIPVQTKLKSVPKTTSSRTNIKDIVEIPATELIMETVMQVRECGFYDSTPPSFAKGEQLHGTKTFSRTVKLQRFAVDITPVTNRQYAEFLEKSHYHPRIEEKFLQHWQKGKPPADKEEHPVVYVDLNDARAYAEWAGKRLLLEEEWQLAAQGMDGRLYPWGNELQPECCNSGETGTTTPVMRYPQGISPFGCYDFCGNTWEWTESERSDGHTRFCILKGGSFYKAQGSIWYFDGGPKPVHYAAKFLLGWPGLDRCATIGFRCGLDLP